MAKPKSDRHTENPVTVRFGPGDAELRTALDAHVSTISLSRNAFILQAVREKLDRDSAAPGP